MSGKTESQMVTGNIVIKLPKDPYDGQQVIIAENFGSSAVCTIDGNGKEIVMDSRHCQRSEPIEVSIVPFGETVLQRPRCDHRLVWCRFSMRALPLQCEKCGMHCKDDGSHGLIPDLVYACRDIRKHAEYLARLITAESKGGAQIDVRIPRGG